jgi:hypothetical protein
MSAEETGLKQLPTGFAFDKSKGPFPPQMSAND